jgi:hypothetical protein
MFEIRAKDLLFEFLHFSELWQMFISTHSYYWKWLIEFHNNGIDTLTRVRRAAAAAVDASRRHRHETDLQSFFRPEKIK